MAEALKINQALQTIDLGANLIGSEGARNLAEALKVNEILQRINLQRNLIGIAGARKLVEALKVNQTLQKIDLSKNLIGSEGAEKLVEALKGNQTLQEIDLRQNSAGNEGARKLAEALKVNQTLQTIDLYDNSIGSEGGRKVGGSITIDLMGNKIDGNILEQIESFLKDSKRIENQPNKSLLQPTAFYSKLMTMLNLQQNIENRLEQVKQLIQDLHMTKFFYLAVSSLWRAGVLSKEMASCHIVASLEKSKELCTGSDEVADFKLILEKAESDGHIDCRQMLCLDNKAERHTVFNDHGFLSLMEAVKSDTARIEGLEANVEAINNSVNAIRKGLKHKMKVEAVVGLLSATINAVSFGVGGNIVTATASALGSIVDYGDIVHIQTVAAKFGDVCVDQVEAGVDIAINKYADKKLEEALKKRNVLTVVAAAAATMHPEHITEVAVRKDEVSTPTTHGPDGEHITDVAARKDEVSTTPTHDPDCEHVTEVAAREDEVNTATTHNAREKPKADEIGFTKSELFKSGVVERLLLTCLQGLDKTDIVHYSECLIKDGFDTIDSICTVEEDDLHFMKKGHKRVLMKKIGELKIAGVKSN
ncbi:hypothetical protein ACHAW6_006537 [Cyclotella cf. meneghiniana]